MNKTKIDWADRTWNPLTGCLHGCEYCYAKRQTERFKGHYSDIAGGNISTSIWKDGDKIHVLDEPLYRWDEDGEMRKAPYPYGFEPTFHRYRLGEPARKTKGRKIFVCSMSDLFGDWVPDSWIEEVFKACEAAPWHTYLFLTKNPKRYLSLYDKKLLPYKENYWFGTTLTKPSDEYVWFERTPYKTFISIEPLLEGFGELEKGVMPKWVIIGQQTGPGAKPPKDEWVQSIIDQCKTAGVPVFIKSPLNDKFQIQEWPEGLK